MQYYVPFAQLPSAPRPGQSEVNGLIVRTAANADGMAAAVQLAIQTTSLAPVYAHVQPYQDLLNPQLRPWRLGATLLSSFGLLAVGIAAVGLFGIVGYVVTQRTNEIGVRLALGATRAAGGGMIVRQALAMTSLGVGGWCDRRACRRTTRRVDAL